MNYISFMKMIKTNRLISEEVSDHLYYNPQVHHVLENAFYELDAAYKIWNFQTVEKRILPLINHVFVEIV